MKIDNLNDVNKLVKVKANCIVALEQAQVMIDGYESTPDCGGAPGYVAGYNCQLSLYQDGSGSGSDMSGCYVGLEVAHSVVQILEAQIKKVDEDLRALGVDTND